MSRREEMNGKSKEELIKSWMETHPKEFNELVRKYGPSTIDLITAVSEKAAQDVEQATSKPPAGMVPLFSKKSVMRLAIGLIIGAGLGFAYWALSPTISDAMESMTSGTLSDMVSSEGYGPYASKVNIQLVNPGSSYLTLKELQQKGEYYAAKANALPFFEFLSQKLAEEEGDHSYTVEELDEMLGIKFAWESIPPSVEVKVTAPTRAETLFLADFAPNVFVDYLIAEERKMHQKEHEQILLQIESAKNALFEAEQELRTLSASLTASNGADNSFLLSIDSEIRALEMELERRSSEMAALIAEGKVGNGDDASRQEQKAALEKQAAAIGAALSEAEDRLNAINKDILTSSASIDPEYISLEARVTALEDQLREQTAELARFLAENDTRRYELTLADVERTSAALSETRKELATMEAEAAARLRARDIEYQVAQAEVDALTAELVRIKNELAPFNISGGNGDAAYESLLAKINRTSAALMEAQQERAALKQQAGQSESDYLAQDLQYRAVQARVDNLDSELKDLNNRLSASLVSSASAGAVADYLAVAKPTTPAVVPPERIQARKALMFGAILGLGGAWVLMNFKWIAAGMPSAGASGYRREEDETAAE